jgi:hypothetical protein
VSKPPSTPKGERFTPWHRQYTVIEGRHPLYPFIRFTTVASNDAPLGRSERRHWEELYLLVIAAGFLLVLVSR